MTTIEFSTLKKYGDLIKNLFNVETRIYDIDNPESSAEFCVFNCKGCGINKGECQNCHLHYASQTGRGLGNQLFLCPKGLSFIMVDFYVRSVPIGCIFIGPMQVRYSDHPELSDIPSLKSSQFNSLQNLMHEIVSLYNSSSYSLSTDLSVDVIPSVSFRPMIEGYTQYSIDLETQLSRLVENGMGENSYPLIVQFVNNLMSVTAGDVSEVRKRIEEVSYILAHASIHDSAVIPACFHETNKYHSEIKKLKNTEDFVEFLSNVVDYFSNIKQTQTNNSTNKNSIVVKKVREYVINHYSEKISLDDVASFCSVSQSYLGNIIYANLGYTFTQYVNAIRIEKSKELLLTTSDSISSISEKCGFNGQSYFTQVFKNIVGKGPTEYRKEKAVTK